MSGPVLALRAAIRARCLADPALAGAMGGAARLHDEAPRGDLPVYATFGDASVRDWSDSGGPGHEQDLALLVWARPGSAASALAAASRMAELLHEADLPLAGHRLVLLRVMALDVDREPESRLARATLRLRALSEVA